LATRVKLSLAELMAGLISLIGMYVWVTSNVPDIPEERVEKSISDNDMLIAMVGTLVSLPNFANHLAGNNSIIINNVLSLHHIIIKGIEHLVIIIPYPGVMIYVGST
jgi:hypothetical protein